MDDVITQWYCEKGCGAILNKRTAAMHTCHGRDDNDPIWVWEGMAAPPAPKLKKDWSPAPLHPLALVEKQAKQLLWDVDENGNGTKQTRALRDLHFSIEYYFDHFPTREEMKEAAKECPVDEQGDPIESAALWGMGWVMGRLGETTKEPKK